MSDDQYVLALIMVAEAGLKENPDDERAAVGATVANRWRVYGKYFSGKPSPTLREVIESTVNAIAGKDVPRYKGNVGDRNHLRATMKAGDCEIFRRALAQAKLLLETKAPITPSGCTAPPYFFNRDRNAPPELAESPLVHGKRDQGWLHSFYGWTGTPGGK